MRLPSRLTPVRFLLAILRARPWLAVGACVCGALWLVPSALLPLVIGHAIDAGIAGGDTAALLGAVAVVLGIGIGQAVFGAAVEFLVHAMWIHGSSSTQRVVAEHTARLGAALPEQADSGDVLAISSSDINHIGVAFEVLGRLFGSIAAFLVVGIALLGSSVILASVALVGVPLAVLGIGPLLAPLQRRKRAQRERLSEVNSLGSDIVSGLRILRGVGGERRFEHRFRAASQRVRRTGVDVARGESWLAAAEVLLPGLVTVAITWIGARLAASGVISVGDLVAFYGAAAFLVVPVGVATEAGHAFSGAIVSARKTCTILRIRAGITDPAHPVELPAGALELHDSETGFGAPAGGLTLVDIGAGAEALAARLARFREATPGERVSLSGVSADTVTLTELRSRVVYAHNQDIWFSGVLRDQLNPATHSTVGIEDALWAADAEDIVAGLPAGLDEPLGERGREVSGGQRQRLNLARALVLDPDVLLLDEPTSAVDAHTEARISTRIAELRSGRTTVVFSQSPLWSKVADRSRGREMLCS